LSDVTGLVGAVAARRAVDLAEDPRRPCEDTVMALATVGGCITRAETATAVTMAHPDLNLRKCFIRWTLQPTRALLIPRSF
jgi:hypothetical protein